jgi:hypothetical protein
VKPNTEHDEKIIAAAWRPTRDCLGGGLESRVAPKHGTIHSIDRGTFNWSDAATTQKGGTVR